MIVAMLDSIQFNAQPNKHTVDYDKLGQAVRSGGWQRWAGQYKCVVADSLEDAAAKIRKQVRHVFSCSSPKLNGKDFTFRMRYETVDEAGSFWHAMGRQSAPFPC